MIGWIIALSFICLLMIGLSVFIVYRYNSLADEHGETLDQIEELLTKFESYEEVLAAVENSEVLVFDPLIGRLVEEGRELAESINGSRNNLGEVLEEKE